MNSSSNTKLTTPAIASEPYTEDAPPVNTSTFFKSNVGIVFKSAQLPPPVVPGTSLRPFIRTNVLEHPMFLRLTVAAPLDPLEFVIDCPGEICGISFKKSSTLVTPASIMSCPSTTAICEELITFGSIILDPVTTTSSTSESVS